MKKTMNSFNCGEMASRSTSLGLLEVLQFRTGCMYLSDLRIALNLPLIQHALRGILPQNYSLREWQDAVIYLTGENHSVATVEEASEFLINYSRVLPRKP